MHEVLIPKVHVYFNGVLPFFKDLDHFAAQLLGLLQQLLLTVPVLKLVISWCPNQPCRMIIFAVLWCTQKYMYM